MHGAGQADPGGVAGLGSLPRPVAAHPADLMRARPKARRQFTRLVRFIQRDFLEVYFACHVSHGRRRLTAGALTPQDAVYLGHLDARKPVSPRHLARHLGIADSTLSAFIKRIVVRLS